MLLLLRIVNFKYILIILFSVLFLVVFLFSLNCSNVVISFISCILSHSVVVQVYIHSKCDLSSIDSSYK
jgi:hypothetical protein